jgi:hypothetical protein
MRFGMPVICVHFQSRELSGWWLRLSLRAGPGRHFAVSYIGLLPSVSMRLLAAVRWLAVGRKCEALLKRCVPVAAATCADMLR